jgi:hypothetical protein
MNNGSNYFTYLADLQFDPDEVDSVRLFIVLYILCLLFFKMFSNSYKDHQLGHTIYMSYDITIFKQVSFDPRKS